MEDLITKLIAVSPIAAALIAMAVLFLRYMTRRDKSWDDTVRHMNEAQVKSHDSCAKTIKENTLVIGQVKQLLETRIKQINGGG